MVIKDDGFEVINNKGKENETTIFLNAKGDTTLVAEKIFECKNQIFLYKDPKKNKWGMLFKSRDFIPKFILKASLNFDDIECVDETNFLLKGIAYNYGKDLIEATQSDVLINGKSLNSLSNNLSTTIVSKDNLFYFKKGNNISEGYQKIELITAKENEKIDIYKVTKENKHFLYANDKVVSEGFDQITKGEKAGVYKVKKNENYYLYTLADNPAQSQLIDINKLPPYDKLIEQGNSAFEQKEYKKSITIFTSAIALQPKQGAAYRLRGVSYLYDGNYESAETNFNKAIQLKDAKAWNCYYMKGQMQNAQKNYRRATQLFDSVFVLNKDWQGEYEVAMAYFFDGQKDKAIAMQTNVANTTENVNNQHVLAAFLLNNGDAKQAENYNNKVLEAFNKGGRPKKLNDVELKDVLFQRADIFSAQKNYSISSIFYKQVIDIDPTKGEYYYKYAVARANWFGALNANQQQSSRQEEVTKICESLSKAQELNYSGNYEDFKGLCDVKRSASVAPSNPVNNGVITKYLWYQVAHMSYPSDYYNVDYAYVTGPEGLSESQVESVVKKSKFRLGFVVKETRVMKCTDMEECNKQVAEFNNYYSVGGTRLGDYVYK
jgi:tetratricopeptide (TPR) repeat protein